MTDPASGQPPADSRIAPEGEQRIAEPRSLFLLACELMGQGRLEDAATALTCALENDPLADRPLAEQLATQESTASGDEQAAATLTGSDGVQFDPADATYSSAKSLLNRAIIQRRLSRWAEAVEDYRRLSQICPDFRAHFVDAAWCYAELSRQQLALGLNGSARSTVQTAADLLAQVPISDAGMSMADAHSRLQVRIQLAVVSVDADDLPGTCVALQESVRLLQEVWPEFLEHLNGDALTTWRRGARDSVQRLLTCFDWTMARQPAGPDLLSLGGAMAVLGRSCHTELVLWDLSIRLLERAQASLQSLADSSESMAQVVQRSLQQTRRWYAQVLLASGHPDPAAAVLERLAEERQGSDTEGNDRFDADRIAIYLDLAEARFAARRVHDAVQTLGFVDMELQRAPDAIDESQEEVTARMMRRLRTECDALQMRVNTLNLKRGDGSATDTPPNPTDVTQVAAAPDVQQLWQIDLLDLAADATTIGDSLGEVWRQRGADAALEILQRQHDLGADSEVVGAMRAAVLASAAVHPVKPGLGMVESEGERALIALDRAWISAPEYRPLLRLRVVLLTRLAVVCFARLESELRSATERWDQTAANLWVEPTAHRVRYYVDAALETTSQGIGLGLETDLLTVCLATLRGRFESLYGDLFKIYGLGG